MKKQEDLDRYFYIAGWIAIAILAVLLLACLILKRDLRHLIPPCIFHSVTGYYCPGCGGTRAFVFFFTGHPVKAFLADPFVPYVILLGGWFMLSQTLALLSGGRFRYPLHFRMIYVFLAIGLILVGFAVKDILLACGMDIMPT